VRAGRCFRLLLLLLLQTLHCFSSAAAIPPQHALHQAHLQLLLVLLVLVLRLLHLLLQVLCCSAVPRFSAAAAFGRAACCQRLAGVLLQLLLPLHSVAGAAAPVLPAAKEWVDARPTALQKPPYMGREVEQKHQTALLLVLLLLLLVGLLSPVLLLL
jgi:hypothetical protein